MTSGLREAWKPPASEDNEYVYKLTAEAALHPFHFFLTPPLLALPTTTSPVVEALQQREAAGEVLDEQQQEAQPPQR